MPSLKALATLTALFISSSAFAHVKPGTWTGKTADGAACSMTAGQTYFENGTHHPLNERIKMTVDGTDFLVGHPPVVDAATTTVYFNHDLFQGIVPTSTGAKALIVDMVHTANEEGPKRFTVIENKWRAGEKTAVVCNDVVHSAI